jgi:hypothetical protein
MGTAGPFTGVKRDKGVTLTAHPHLVQRSRMSRSYTLSLPWCLHGGSGTALFTLYYILYLYIIVINIVKVITRRKRKENS